MIISNPVNLSLLQHREYPDLPWSIGGFTWRDIQRRYNWQPGNTPQIYQINRDNCNSSYGTASNLAFVLTVEPTLTNWEFIFGLNAPALVYGPDSMQLPPVNEFMVQISDLDMPTSDVISYCGLFSTADFKARTVSNFIGLEYTPIPQGVSARLMRFVNGERTNYGDNWLLTTDTIADVTLRINRDRSVTLVYDVAGETPIINTAPAGAFVSPSARMLAIQGSDNTVADQTYGFARIDMAYYE